MDRVAEGSLRPNQRFALSQDLRAADQEGEAVGKGSAVCTQAWRHWHRALRLLARLIELQVANVALLMFSPNTNVSVHGDEA